MTGTLPVGYQWRKDGVDLPGATARLLPVVEFDAALADPDFPEDAVLLWDIRDSTSLKGRSGEELQKITMALGPASQAMRTAS